MVKKLIDISELHNDLREISRELTKIGNKLFLIQERVRKLDES